MRYVEWWIACPIVLSDWKVTHSISIQMPAEEGTAAGPGLLSAESGLASVFPFWASNKQLSHYVANATLE